MAAPLRLLLSGAGAAAGVVENWMLGGIGVLSIVFAGVVVVAAAVFAVLYFRFRVFRGRRGRRRRNSSQLNQGRVEVLESTDIDADRRLVLVRCDRIEHLIMVGGPADLVVENDVKKVRGPGTAAPQAAGASGGLADLLGGSGASASERPSRSAGEHRALAPPRPAPTRHPRPCPPP